MDVIGKAVHQHHGRPIGVVVLVVGYVEHAGWSPNWKFDDACFERTAIAHDNPDYVDVVIHSYRHRYGLAEGDPQYAGLQRQLAALPAISVPTITLDGDADGVAPATDGTSSAAKFTGRRTHRVIPHAGHNLPQEEPEAFAAAVIELAKG